MADWKVVVGGVGLVVSILLIIAGSGEETAKPSKLAGSESPEQFLECLGRGLG